MKVLTDLPNLRVCASDTDHNTAVLRNVRMLSLYRATRNSR